jgi:hypothetical protein
MFLRNVCKLLPDHAPPTYSSLQTQVYSGLNAIQSYVFYDFLFPSSTLARK